MADTTAADNSQYKAAALAALAPQTGKGPLTTADGTPLKAALGKAQRQARIRAFILVAPLLAFILITFIAPIGSMLFRSVNNDSFSANAPALSQWFDQNPGIVGVPEDEAAWAALAADLRIAKKERTAGQMGTRINYDLPGSRSLFTKTGRRADKLEAPFKEAFEKVDKRWVDPDLWGVMRRGSSPNTASFYYSAVDLTQQPDGSVVAVDEKRAVYKDIFVRTLILSALIAGLCFLLGFPVAHMLATVPTRYANLLLILVLLPFWTSLLVRTTSWIVLLQSQGVVNDALDALGFFTLMQKLALFDPMQQAGIIGSTGRLEMMFNQAGTIIAMVHILLPFMILPLFSVMKTIPPSYVRAARSLGASQPRAFWKVYFPQTIPGIGAGLLLVFILAVGYYITPALVGGAKGTLISNLIAFHIEKSFNWSLAAALSAILLVIVLIMYWLYDRIIGIDNMKLG
ncbi:ABC transporter permease [Ahrensia sp. R2A130]|uniref:ABC transporter permease n=1 Tax=Ahrensia sp. R2A130 TaxID=744979 RepID=UPI0001E0E8B3|nr:ABC transporter permease [Ahrensia sp. R2A130]EFL89148.1 binding-protein-dependent transport systems inner membrane component [Ahrensia sp. R2A130]